MYLGKSTQPLNHLVQSIDVQIYSSNHWCLVNWSASLIHKLVQLCDESILLFKRLIVIVLFRALREEKHENIQLSLRAHQLNMLLLIDTKVFTPSSEELELLSSPTNSDRFNSQCGGSTFVSTYRMAFSIATRISIKISHSHHHPCSLITSSLPVLIEGSSIFRASSIVNTLVRLLATMELKDNNQQNTKQQQL